MCLGMLPGMAWADEIKYKPDSSGKYVESTKEESITLEGVQKVAAAKVAKIEGGESYETLAEAIANVTDGDTIKLLDNVTLSEKLVIDNGKTFTISRWLRPSVSFADSSLSQREPVVRCF